MRTAPKSVPRVSTLSTLLSFTSSKPEVAHLRRQLPFLVLEHESVLQFDIAVDQPMRMHMLDAACETEEQPAVDHKMRERITLQLLYEQDHKRVSTAGVSNGRVSPSAGSSTGPAL